MLLPADERVDLGPVSTALSAKGPSPVKDVLKLRGSALSRKSIF